MWVTVEVTQDIRPGVCLARASNVQWIQIIKSIEAEVVTTLAIVIEDGEIVEI